MIGIPVYICEGEEIPITYSLITLGLAQGPAMTFLLGGCWNLHPNNVICSENNWQKTNANLCRFLSQFLRHYADFFLA